MSTYTTELRFYCETLAGFTSSQGYDKVDEVVNKAAPLIFEKFPIFDEEYRLTLEIKILKHYYTREIGAETPGLWKLWLNTRLKEIMPYYNLLYQSTTYEYNPLRDYDLHREKEGKSHTNKDMNGEGSSRGTVDITSTGETTENTNSDSTGSGTQSATIKENKDELYKFSNTPQGSIDGPLFTDYLTEASDTTGDLSRSDDVESSNTAHNASDSTSSSQGKSSQDSESCYTNSQSDLINTTDSYIEHVYGKLGVSSYSKLIMEYRESLINIDMMIIDDLTDLFMLIY